jgi:quercetin dioxygenase-like cupin family protein
VTSRRLVYLEVLVSSITRALTGENLTFDLAGQIAELRQDESYARTGRLGRTLVKAGQLRLTLTVIAEGVQIGTHHAASPMTLQPLEGGLSYHVDDDEFEIGQGEVLFFGPGHAQDIRALEDTALLLTITGDGRAGIDPLSGADEVAAR